MEKETWKWEKKGREKKARSVGRTHTTKKLSPQRQLFISIGGIMRIRTVDLIDVSDAL